MDDLLAYLHLEAKARILVLNKIDLLVDQDLDEEYAKRLKTPLDQNRVVTVSATKAWGLEQLLKAIVDLLGTRNGEAQDGPGFWAYNKYRQKHRQKELT